ncbi:uncharacterized protein LOC128293782 [Gossypium arboreum]|uniref:uncharacterized protein LOC128293782 n=1 Tax=Gossypium arboreum TaxID=29729 RepID=UPI0022F15893|nr:uncharacterized protein LOC128293782 [Gossypium arboreum]
MHPEDMEKTTFITLWGTFCYKVMPFDLKNAGATYQRAMVTLFHDMMHKEIEVYVDDMIAKSRIENEHLQVLKRLFLRLRKFQLKLNPTKCTFGARSGKLLGFIVSEKGIIVDPDKVRAIQKLAPPRTQKEVCGIWDDECQKAFDKVKHYLFNPPVLTPPSPNRPLILYLTVFDSSIGCVLGQHDETGRKEKAIYYLNLMYVETTEEDTSENSSWKLNFDGASNAVEYEACIMGIRAAIDRKIKVLEFDDVTFFYLPHDENQMADALATLASMIRINKQDDMKPIQMSICDAPAHCCNIDEEEERDNHPWYHDILRYVKNREYPGQATENDKRMLRRLANDYILDGEILYKKRKDQILLRCVDAVEAKRILEEVHEGVCGTHANEFTMARKIMRFGYYWSTMQGDCISYAKKCHKCQIYGDKIHVPPSLLHRLLHTPMSRSQQLAGS